MPTPGIQLYDAKTGRPLSFGSADEAHAALDAGVAGVSKKAPIAMIDPDGQAVTVAPTDLAQARAAGARLATGEEVRHAELAAKYGRGGTLADAAYGFLAKEAGHARGLTAGLSDVAAVELGKGLLGAERGNKVRQFLADMKEYHPTTSTAAEVGGYLGGALIGNEAGAAQGAGRLARYLPSALIDSAGAGVESMVARGLGPAEGVLAKAGNAALRLGARGAVETSIANVADAVSEAELGDHELNAEKLFAAAQQGALMGGLGAGALGGAGSLAGSAAKGIATKLAPHLRDAASEQWWKAINPAKKFTEEANARAGGTAAVGRTIADEVIGNMGIADIARKASTPEDLAPLITAAKERIGQEIGKITEGSTARVKVQTIADAFDKVIAPLRGLADHEAFVAKLENSKLSWLEKLGGVEAMPNGTVRFVKGAEARVQDVLAQRRALDDLIFEEAKQLNPQGVLKYRREIRGHIEDAIMSSMDDAAKREGNATLRTELEAAKKKYQHLSLAEKAADNAADARMSNRTFSISDTGAMLTAAGGALASGNPIEALAAPLAGYGHKLIRERGNAVAAGIMDRVSAFAAIRKEAAKVDAKIGDAVEAYLTPRGPRPRLGKLASAGESPSAEYDRRVKALDEVRANPAAAVERAHQRVAPVAAFAPMTAQAHAGVTGRAISYLLQQEPKGRVPSVSTMPLAEKPRITDTQKDAFNDVARAVEDPVGTMLNGLETGTLTRAQVQAIKHVTPKVHEQVVGIVRTKLATMKEPPSYQKVQQLSILLDAPLDETQTPQFIAAMQQAAANGNNTQKQQQQGAPPATSKRPINLDTSVYATQPEMTK